MTPLNLNFFFSKFRNHIEIIETAAAKTNDPPMAMFIDEWSTMGKIRRPNVRDLLKICLDVEEISAASYIYEEIMKKGPILPKDVDKVKETLKDDIWGIGDNNEGFVHIAVSYTHLTLPTTPYV